MKFFSIIPVLFVFMTTSLAAAAPLTLDEALTTALKNHPLAVEARENLNGAEARTGQALANYYPQISIAADWSKGRSFLTANESVKSIEVQSEALYLKQTIYDFGRTAGAVAAARGNSAAVAESLAVTRQDLAFRVRAAYYLVLAAGKQVDTVRETVLAREEVYRQARGGCGAGRSRHARGADIADPGGKQSGNCQARTG